MVQVVRTSFSLSALISFRFASSWSFGFQIILEVFSWSSSTRQGLDNVLNLRESTLRHLRSTIIEWEKQGIGRIRFSWASQVNNRKKKLRPKSV